MAASLAGKDTRNATSEDRPVYAVRGAGFAAKGTESHLLPPNLQTTSPRRTIKGRHTFVPHQPRQSNDLRWRHVNPARRPSKETTSPIHAEDPLPRCFNNRAPESTPRSDSSLPENSIRTQYLDSSPIPCDDETFLVFSDTPIALLDNLLGLSESFSNQLEIPEDPEGSNENPELEDGAILTDQVSHAGSTYRIDQGNHVASPHTIIGWQSPTSSLSPFSHLSDDNFFYLQYVDEQVAKQTLNMDLGPLNPLRRLVLPRAFYSHGLLNSICAVAACHQKRRADTSAQEALGNIATEFYQKSIQWLMSTLSTQSKGLHEGAAGTLRESLVLTGSMLCKYEVINGRAASWRAHLRGLESLIQSCGGIAALDDDCGKYVASFFRYHRTISDMCDWSLEIENEQEQSYLEMIAPSTAPVDDYSGCAFHFINVCRMITRLACRLETQEPSLHDQFVNRINYIVESLQTTVERPFIREDIPAAQRSMILFVSNRIRFAAFTLLHAAIDRAIDLFDVDDNKAVALRCQIPYTQAQSLDGCLGRLQNVPIGDHCEFGAMALPLFLAGCEVKIPDLRGLVLEKLLAIQSCFGLGHLEDTQTALKVIWQRSDDIGQKLPWWRILQDMKWEPNLV